jgi:hypothetical protein
VAARIDLRLAVNGDSLLRENCRGMEDGAMELAAVHAVTDAYSKGFTMRSEAHLAAHATASSGVHGDLRALDWCHLRPKLTVKLIGQE